MFLIFLKNQETELEFWRMDSQDAYYKDIIDLFRLAYNKKLLTEQAMGRGGNCGHTGEEPCDTGEVVITVPKPGGPKGDPNLYLPGANPGGGDPGVIGGGCGVYGNCDGGGSTDNTNSSDESCEKTKALINKPKVKDSLNALKAHAQTNTKKERGFQELKNGTLVKGNVNGDNQIEFGIGQNSLGTVHSHQLGTIGIFAPQDIMTFLHIVRAQDANSLGSAYSGTVSSSGTYFINFIGTAYELPSAMTEAQEAAYVSNLVADYVDFNDLLLEKEGKSRNEKLSNQGLEKLFNYLLKTMGLNGKIALIKEESGSTSTIEFNSDGTPKTPIPC